VLSEGVWLGGKGWEVEWVVEEEAVFKEEEEDGGDCISDDDEFATPTEEAGFTDDIAAVKIIFVVIGNDAFVTVEGIISSFVVFPIAFLV